MVISEGFIINTTSVIKNRIGNHRKNFIKEIYMILIVVLILIQSIDDWCHFQNQNKLILLSISLFFY